MAIRPYNILSIVGAKHSGSPFNIFSIVRAKHSGSPFNIFSNKLSAGMLRPYRNASPLPECFAPTECKYLLHIFALVKSMVLLIGRYSYDTKSYESLSA